VYPTLLSYFDDPAPRVRHTAAWTFFRIIENLPEVIFSSQEFLNAYIEKTLPKIDDHFTIAVLVI